MKTQNSVERNVEEPRLNSSDKSANADLHAYLNGRLDSEQIEVLWQMMMVYPSLHRYLLTMVLLRYMVRQLLWRRVVTYPLRPTPVEKR